MKYDTKVAIFGIIMMVSFISALLFIVFDVSSITDKCENECNKCIMNLSCSTNPSICSDICNNCLSENLTLPRLNTLIPIILFCIAGFIYIRYFIPMGGL
jgi:hypothetical protein